VARFSGFCPTAAGTPRWWDVVAAPALGPDGAVHRVVVTSRDVTDARAAADALRRSREQLQAALAASGTGTFRWDLRTDALEWDENLDRLFGLPPGEVVRSLDAFLAHVHPDDRAGVVDRCAACREHGCEFDMEFRVVWPDGSVHWLDDKGKTYLGSDGRPAYMTGACVDVTARKLNELALAESQQRLDIALRSAEVGHWQLDLATGAIDCTPQCKANFGLPPDAAVTYDGLLARVVDEDRPGVRAAVDRAVASGTEYAAEYRVRWPDGQVRWVHARGRAFRDLAGAATHMAGVTVDVTARRRDEDDLRESEQRFRVLAEAVPQIVWTNDPGGAVDYLNSRWGLFTGTPAERSLGRGWAEALHPEDRPRVAARWDECVGAGVGYEVEYRLRRADGQHRWVLARALPVRDHAGTIVRWFGTCTDIHDQKAAEERARASDRLHRTLFEALPSIAWVNHPDGRVNYFNSLWTAYTGLTARPASYDDWTAAFHPDDRAALLGTRAPAIVRGEAYAVDCRLRRAADGAWRWHHFRVTPLRNEAGALFGWLGTATDIDDLRAAKDEAERAGRSKDEFLAALSHELRTPLTPVLLTAQVLERDPSVPEHVRADLRMIRRNVGIETRLIDDLLDLTRITRGKVQLHLDRVDLHDVLAHAVDTCRDDVVSEKRLRLEIEPAAGRHHLSADPARLGQVFWNLVKNAVKFTPAGGTVTVRTWNPSPDRVCVSVTDTGVGIDPAVLPHVFNAFEQGGAQVTRQFGGLGLGLAISRAITELHGGAIAAASDGPGTGATFTVELPTAAALPAPVPPTSEFSGVVSDAPKPELTPPRGRAALLLVEDHESTGQVMRRLLTAEGYEVEWVATAAAAVHAAGRRRFDLVVSDLGLPDGTGHELMRELRAVHGLRGIALSGFGMDHDVARGQESGFVRHLVKPVTVEVLDAAIRQVLNPT
ncbi:MAG TPA: PAS domain-containing protein, partial [Humisphaera sp.]